jgi:acyl-CoA thioester hydrolase
MPSSSTRLRVRYAETDQMNMVYYANYLVWFEVARTDFLRQHGWTYREMEAGGIRLPVIEARCRYHRPARYDDEIEIRTEGRLLTPVRLEFTYEVVLAETGTVVATGLTQHAGLTMDDRPCRLPERIRKVFA